MTTATPDILALRGTIAELLSAIVAEERAQAGRIALALPRHRQSAENLAHYLAIRNRDVHRLQLDLAAVGLSSLGRSEGHVRDLLLRLDGWLSGRRRRAVDPGERLDWAAAEGLLHANTEALFGPRPEGRHVHIMVTAPETITDAWADELLAAGANLLRINAAHGTPEAWAATAATFKARAAARGRPCRVFIDLPGPKLRADVVGQREAVIHLPRHKDRLGRTVEPTIVGLVASYGGGPQIPVPQAWLADLAPNDRLELVDSGGRRRELTVIDRQGGEVRASSDRSLFLTSSLPIAWWRGDRLLAKGETGELPAEPAVALLGPGDPFLIRPPGDLRESSMPVLSLPEPHLLARVKAGERVVLDDAKLVAVVEEASPEGLRCRVKHATSERVKLRSGKGVAFPDSDLEHGHLGAHDALALRVALEHADGVGVSFVNTPEDVSLVGQRIRESGRQGFGMILKLETRSATRHLPAILFEALQYDAVGLMIARGDLAVELSFERLAEMQEEILWFGEACHLPVIWATQVLDSAARCGLPTRAEITDAAMSMRAECVMLNKGPQIAVATRMLADIISKMEAHQYKKRALYRKLAMAAGA